MKDGDGDVGGYGNGRGKGAAEGRGKGAAEGRDKGVPTDGGGTLGLDLGRSGGEVCVVAERATGLSCNVCCLYFLGGEDEELPELEVVGGVFPLFSGST